MIFLENTDDQIDFKKRKIILIAWELFKKIEKSQELILTPHQRQ